jgi:hypothetical protein
MNVTYRGQCHSVRTESQLRELIYLLTCYPLDPRD